MKFVIAAGIVLVTFVTSSFASLFAMGAAAGPDIGFAGAGLWFVMAPAALVGMLLAWPATRKASPGAVARGMAFAVAAPVFSAVLSLLPVLAFTWLANPAAPAPEGGEFVYVLPENDTRTDIEVNRYPALNTPVPMRVEVKSAAWQKVRRRDVKPGRRAFERPLSTRDPALAGDVTYEWRPANCMRLAAPNADGTAQAVFLQMETLGSCDIEATFRNPWYDGTTKAYASVTHR